MSKVFIDGKEVEANVTITTSAVVTPTPTDPVPTDPVPTGPLTPREIGQIIPVTWEMGRRGSDVPRYALAPGEVISFQFTRSQLVPVSRDETRFQGALTLYEASILKMAVTTVPGTFYTEVGPSTPQAQGNQSVNVNYITNKFFDVPLGIQYGAKVIPDGDILFVNVKNMTDSHALACLYY